MLKLLTALFVTLVAAAPAAAQDYKPVSANIGFGVTFPTADFKKSFDPGWNGNFGVTFNINGSGQAWTLNFAAPQVLVPLTP